MFCNTPVMAICKQGWLDSH